MTKREWVEQVIAGIDPETVVALNVTSETRMLSPDPQVRAVQREFTGRSVVTIETGARETVIACSLPEGWR